MGRHNFHGRVETLGDSCQADYLVMVICDRCQTQKQMHPYKLIAAKKLLTTAPLGSPLPGFFCKTCRRSTSVTITVAPAKAAPLASLTVPKIRPAAD